MRHRTSSLKRVTCRPAAHRPGFTLIEMLVATALVVLMLLLFARIFGDTVGIMRKQQSLIQNDQRARNLDTILRNDLNKMTFRQPSTPGVYGIVPLNASWPVDANQQGFFYYSENDLENPVDDVLHFTFNQMVRTRDKDVATIRGRAQRLGRPFVSGVPFPDDNGNMVQDETNAATDYGGLPLTVVDSDLNQPDYDDGTVGDNLGQSSAGEVVYFVRNGNLYRRVLLLRDPQTPINVNSLSAGGFTDPYPIPPDTYSSQPGMGVNGSTTYVNSAGNPHMVNRKFMRLDNSGSEPIPVASDYSAALDAGSNLDTFGTTNNRADFWNDFDYSASNQWVDVNNNNALDIFPADRYELVFNGIDSLLNHPGGTEYPIALPQHRFGHRPALAGMLITAAPKSLAGQPMEYLLNVLGPTGTPALSTVGLTPGTNAGFIGRFTHSETSSSNAGSPFGYPGIVPQDGVAGVPSNPFLRTYADGWDSTDRNGIVDAYSDGPRTGEDLLIANVEGFDVEVWDDGFVEVDINGNGTLDAWEDTNSDGVLNTFPGIFTDLGHDSTHPSVAAAPYLSGLGYFRQGNNQNVTYGPRTVAGSGLVNRVYDTWHPRADVGAYAPVLAQRSGKSPFALYRIGGSSSYTTGGNTLHQGRVGSEWAPLWSMYRGHYVFPGVDEDPNANNAFDMSEDANGNGVLDPGEDLNANNALDPDELDRNGNGLVDHNEDLNHDGLVAPDDDGDMLSDEDKNGDGHVGLSTKDDWSYYYKVIGYRDPPIDIDGDGTVGSGEDIRSGTKAPEWLRRPGHVIYDGNVIWKCFDNRVPLQMIRITCRYRDPASGAPRQVSIVHSFVD